MKAQLKKSKAWLSWMLIGLLWVRTWLWLHTDPLYRGENNRKFQQNLHTMLTKLSDQRWLVSQDTTNSKYQPWKNLVLDKTRSAYAELSSGLSSKQTLTVSNNVNRWTDKVTYRHSVARAWKQETVAKAINSQQGGTELGQAQLSWEWL